MYSHREEQNNQKFDRLANTLHQFRSTINDDIEGSLAEEGLTTNALNDNISQLIEQAKRRSMNLRNTFSRNTSLNKAAGIIFLTFFCLWVWFKIWKN